MSDPTPPTTYSATAMIAAQHVRLLAATVDIVADAYDPLEGEPFFPLATSTAAIALLGLAEGVPEHTEQALSDLTAIVASLPIPPGVPRPAGSG